MLQLLLLGLLSRTLFLERLQQRTHIVTKLSMHAFQRNAELAIKAVARNYFCKAHTLFTIAPPDERV